MATADCSGRRWRAACSARAEAAAGKIAAAAHASARPATAAAPTMLLMPGADVAPDVREETESALTAGGAAQAQAQAQLTIMYGGRVLVFDGVPADVAVQLMRAAAAWPGVAGGLADMPVPRKMSLQRFMEKRRDRLCSWAPYTTARSRWRRRRRVITRRKQTPAAAGSGWVHQEEDAGVDGATRACRSSRHGRRRRGLD